MFFAMAVATAPDVSQVGSVQTCQDEEVPLSILPSQGPLAQLIGSTKQCVLQPAAFFIAWSGVLTLAYTGFPDALRALKHNINNSLPSLGKENPGSRWPKTSLGCLKEGCRLTPEQLKTLHNICTQESGVFQQPQSKRAQAVLVDQLEVVLYECRCLERKISKHVVPLRSDVDISEPSRDEKARVQSVLGEMDASDYWYHASRDGNRESHYRGIALGATLVHELAGFTNRAQALATTPLSRPPSSHAMCPPAEAAEAAKQPHVGDIRAFSCVLPSRIRAFQARVNRELPGLYTWFAEDSLHVTIRALVG